MIKIGAPTATIDTPIEHLSACHRRIEDRLETLVRAADFLKTDRARALAAIGKSFEFLGSSGVLHTEDEENSLFPRLRKKLDAEQIAYLDALEQDHQRAELVLSRLKALAADVVDQSNASEALIGQYRGCAEELRALYTAHIRSEDEILTALAKGSLSASELSEVSNEMRERRESRRRLSPTVE